jgi:hypothetical protein
MKTDRHCRLLICFTEAGFSLKVYTYTLAEHDPAHTHDTICIHTYIHTYIYIYNQNTHTCTHAKKHVCMQTACTHTHVRCNLYFMKKSNTHAH